MRREGVDLGAAAIVVTYNRADLLRSEFPEVAYHRLEENLGFGGGLAVGIAAAVLLLDRKSERVRLRLLGAWHALRGVRGRTVEPGP